MEPSKPYDGCLNAIVLTFLSVLISDTNDLIIAFNVKSKDYNISVGQTYLDWCEMMHNAHRVDIINYS